MNTNLIVGIEAVSCLLARLLLASNVYCQTSKARL